MLDAGPFITSIEISIRFFPQRGPGNEGAAAIDGVPPRSAEMASTKRRYVVNSYNNPIQHRSDRSGSNDLVSFLKTL
jgi:hypothetical protein